MIRTHEPRCLDAAIVDDQQQLCELARLDLIDDLGLKRLQGRIEQQADPKLGPMIDLVGLAFGGLEIDGFTSDFLDSARLRQRRSPVGVSVEADTGSAFAVGCRLSSMDAERDVRILGNGSKDRFQIRQQPLDRFGVERGPCGTRRIR